MSVTINGGLTTQGGWTVVMPGGPQAIFGYGYTSPSEQSMTNKVSNTGIVSADTTGVGTTRSGLAAASYGAT